MAIVAQQGFPQIQARFVNERGDIEQVWLQLLIQLWKRTGSGAGVDITVLVAELTLLIGNPLQALVADLQDELNSLRQQVATLRGEEAEVLALPSPVVDFEALLPPGAPPAEDVPVALPVATSWSRGNWTPVLDAATTPPTGATYSGQSGIWYRSGDIVALWGTVTIDDVGTGGAGNIIITGCDLVPFPDFVAFGEVLLTSVTFDAGYASALVKASVSGGALLLELFENGDNVAGQNVPWGALANGSAVEFSIILVVP